MIAPAPIQSVFSERLRDSLDLLEEIKRRGIGEQAAATVMLNMTIEQAAEDIERMLYDVVAELEIANSRTEGRRQ